MFLRVAGKLVWVEMPTILGLPRLSSSAADGQRLATVCTCGTNLIPLGGLGLHPPSRIAAERPMRRAFVGMRISFILYERARLAQSLLKVRQSGPLVQNEAYA